MTSIFEKYAKLKQLYPEDIERIEQEERSVSELLEEQDYASHPGTKRLIAMCRVEIKTARVKLASDRTLSEQAIRELWQLIDSRQWYIQLVAKDFATELAAIETGVTAELERGL